MARRHLLFVLSGAVAEELETHRRHWDPVMAERAPAHVTLVYPEEVDDEPLLLERAATATEHVAPFSIWLGAPAAADGGREGVWFSVEDPSDSWHQLREMILAPPFTPISVTPHATVVHPRTSDLGLQAADSLHHTRIGGESPLTELLLTETEQLLEKSTGALHALDITDGTINWVIQFGALPESYWPTPLLVVDETVFVADADGELAAIQLHTGEQPVA